MLFRNDIRNFSVKSAHFAAEIQTNIRGNKIRERKNRPGIKYNVTSP